MSEKVVVTGAAGFIGSHLSQRLEQENVADLVLVDDFSRGKQEYLDVLGVKTKCVKLDVKNYESTKKLIEKASVVYHIAARIGGVQYLHGTHLKELAALQDNLLIDASVFKACAECGVEKVIYTSSVSVYPTEPQFSEGAIFKEEDTKTIDPEGGYGWAKFIGEKQLDLMSECDIKVGIARIFKSYGPCDDYSEESGQVVCSLCRKAINYPKEKFVVWGDGSATRCLVYIDDLTDAFIKLEKEIDNEFLTVNLGGNSPVPIKKLAGKIVKTSGKDIDIKYDSSKPIGPLSRIPDLSRAKKLLDWEPTTSLDDGLRKTYHWLKETLNE